MKLWNDYEGKIIADAYPLKKLLRPEGRSAFFVTSAKDGVAEVIRITESLNDEHEMLERWRQVSEVHQANLVEIKTYGATTFDGVPLTYALMEATDGSLAEILKERPLTAAETMQVATSVMAALGALHAIGLVHEHIEPASILATGEVVKLRSDCVRECVVDAEFNPQRMCDEVRQRDVRDLAMLLLQCLTLERQWTSAVRLPAPFEQVIRNGLEGTWGLAEMEAALRKPVDKPLVPVEVLAQPRPAQGLPPQGSERIVPEEGLLAVRDSGVPGSQGNPARAGDAARAPGSGARVLTEPDVRTTTRRLHLRRLVRSTVSQDGLPGWPVVAGVVGLLLALLVWFFLGRRPATAPAGVAAVPAAVQPLATEAVPGKVRVVPDKTAQAPVAKAAMQPGWHVIAYTYLHESQAAAKAAFVARHHPGLNPKVFAPAGRSPYYVALGGGMSESEAAAVLRTARRDGLPRDTFIRLYRSR